ncbi:hypothetical protein BDW69DRAFT_190290 [Aspergillus filifer]
MHSLNLSTGLALVISLLTIMVSAQMLTSFTYPNTPGGTCTSKGPSCATGKYSGYVPSPLSTWPNGTEIYCDLARSPYTALKTSVKTASKDLKEREETESATNKPINARSPIRIPEVDILVQGCNYAPAYEQQPETRDVQPRLCPPQHNITWTNDNLLASQIVRPWPKETTVTCRVEQIFAIQALAGILAPVSSVEKALEDLKPRGEKETSTSSEDIRCPKVYCKDSVEVKWCNKVFSENSYNETMQRTVNMKQVADGLGAILKDGCQLARDGEKEKYTNGRIQYPGYWSVEINRSEDCPCMLSTTVL